MKTQIKKSGDTIIVTMEGYLDFGTYIPLKEDLDQLMQATKTDTTPKKIIFNFEDLEFVGSSGISSFIQTLKDFNSNVSTKPRYCHVKSEFQKIIKAFDEESIFEIYENQEGAQKSFELINQ